MSGRVIVVGSVNIDLVAHVPQLPHPGETVMGGTYERHHGGKGGNQAVAAARLGRPTLLIGAVGDDPFQAEAKRALTSERVDVSMVATLRGQPTGVALILVDSAGENEIAVVPGANGAIGRGYVRDCLSRLGPLSGDVLLVCNEIPLEIVREALVCACAAGAITILNPAPATGIDRSIFSLADIVTPNRTELETLLRTEAKRSGQRAPTTTDPAGRARALLAAGPEGAGVRKAVIVTLGAWGAAVLQRVGSGLEGKPSAADAGADRDAPAGLPFDGERAVPATIISDAPPVKTTLGVRSKAAREPELVAWDVQAAKVSTVDSTGAGDAFCGALAAALAEGRPLGEAVNRAVAGGGLATTRSGAREGMPTSAELEEFLAPT
jgi:ribokinase